MTGEEAIEVLKELWRYEKTDKYTDGQIREVLDIAIEAIKQQQTDAKTRQNFHKLIDQADSKVYEKICKSVADDHCFYEDNAGTLHMLDYCQCDECPYKNQNSCVEALVAYLMEGENEVII